MKWTKILLFSIGIVFEIFAFVISNSDNLPIVYRCISIDYYNANQGYKKLSNDRSLMPGDKGFEEIYVFAEDFLLQANSQELVNKFVIDSIKCDSYAKFYAGREFSGWRTNVYLYISNGQKLNWYLEDIIPRIEQLKNKSIFHWSIFLVALGIMFQIWSFLIGNKRDRKLKKPQEFKKEKPPQPIHQIPQHNLSD